MTPDQLGKIAYNAYCGKREWKSVKGERLPAWNDQDEGLRAAWIEAAAAVGDAIDREVATLFYKAITDSIAGFQQASLDGPVHIIATRGSFLEKRALEWVKERTITASPELLGRLKEALPKESAVGENAGSRLFGTGEDEAK